MANQKGDTTSTGHFWNKCVDAVNKKFETFSFWSKASDTEFNDGGNAETKVGAIKGITSDLNTTTTGYAADMTTVAKINSSLQDSSSGESFNFGSLNGVRGFFTDPSKADDSFVPFKSDSGIQYWYIYKSCSRGATSMSIKDYCDKWNEITKANGYYISAFSNVVYSRDSNTYAYNGCSYNASTGILSWDTTMNAIPTITCLIVYDPSKDARIG